MKRLTNDIVSPLFPPYNGLTPPDYYELRFYEGGYWHIFSCFCKNNAFIRLDSGAFKCPECGKRYGTNGDNSRPKEVTK